MLKKYFFKLRIVLKKYSEGMDKMKLMRTEDAVGQVLCHDITQIIKGVTKDAVFRKGHIITEEDIPVLLSVGKDHIYIWENNENMLHENDAAKILYDMCANEHTYVRIGTWRTLLVRSGGRKDHGGKQP